MQGSPVLPRVIPPGGGGDSSGSDSSGGDNLLCARASVLPERFGHKAVLKQSQLNKVHYCCLLLWEVRPPLDFPWLPPTSEEHRNWLISLENVEGHGSKLQHFYIVIIDCYMQPEKG